MHEPTVPRLIAAMHYAAFHHRDQRRKGESAAPYINHPIALLNVLANEAGVTDPDVLVAAVLHDVIEDCARDAAERALRSQEIEALFGREVLDIVLDVTDDKDLEKVERKQHQVIHAAQLSHQAKLVKLADKISNLRDVANEPPPWDLQRRQDYFDWAGSVVQAMGPKVHRKLDTLFAEALRLRPSAAA